MENKFTHSTVQQFRKDFQDTVAELEKKYGVTINLGRITYDSTSVRGKITALKGDRGEVLTKEDFKIGENVKISHKKILPDLIFEIQKINQKNIKVVNVYNRREVFTVSPSLLRKI